MSDVLGEGFDLEPEAPLELEGVEVEAEDENTPPDPVFLIQPNAYGQGTERVSRSDGEAVGLWLAREHADLDGEGVFELLTGLGLDEKRASWFGGWRQAAIEAREALAENEALAGMQLTEERSQERTKLVRQAFLKQLREQKK